MAIANAMKSVRVAVVGLGCLVAVLFLLSSLGDEDRQRAPQQGEQPRQVATDTTREEGRAQATPRSDRERPVPQPTTQAEHIEEPTAPRAEGRPIPPSEQETAPAEAPHSRTFVRGRVVSERESRLPGRW